MSRIRIPGPLQLLADGTDELGVEAETVHFALAELVAQHPRLRRHLFDDGGVLRGYVNIYLNDDDVRYLDGMTTKLGADDVITIVPSVAGGIDTPLSVAELGRYSRHLALTEVGLEGQAKLKAARVLIVGAGGLGSPAGLYLAAAGVGHIGIIDHDLVDASNLQRQVLFRTDHVGRPKAEIAAHELERLNPEIEVVPIVETLTSANALSILTRYDVIIDG